MIGVGGAGMSGMAQVLSGLGYAISGSDINPGPTTERLSSMGVRIMAGHDPNHVEGADLVISTAAVKDDNPEVRRAVELDIPVISRAEMLGCLLTGNKGIAVAGTHGKTTTTAMLAVLLDKAGMDPTVLIGGDLDAIGGNAKLGESDYVVIEACEAFGSFLELSPSIAVVTNIEAEHLDYYGTLEGVTKAFQQFLTQVNGTSIVCIDSPNVRKLLPSITGRVITYGESEDADIRAHEISAGKPHPKFKISIGGRSRGEFRLSVPGRHNVLNSLAVFGVGRQLGITSETIRESLAEFKGTGRRFEVLGTEFRVTVVDDYAHHPTEIAATLRAARSWHKRIVAIFQPHLFSRTQMFKNEFAEALRLADEVIISEIYPAREQPIPGVSAASISSLINKVDPGKSRFVADKLDVAGSVISTVIPGDLVVVMGAGDIRIAAEQILARLKERENLG